MKGYLTRFNVPAAQRQRITEKDLSEEPSKPSKLGSDGFDGSSQRAFSGFQPLEVTNLGPSTCPRCSAQAQVSETDRSRHLWCAANGCSWDRWEATEGGTLGGAFGEPPCKQTMAEALACHECPECHAKLDLQDREHDVWRCAGCRLWIIAGVVQ